MCVLLLPTAFSGMCHFTSHENIPSGTGALLINLTIQTPLQTLGCLQADRVYLMFFYWYLSWVGSGTGQTITYISGNPWPLAEQYIFSPSCLIKKLLCASRYFTLWSVSMTPLFSDKVFYIESIPIVFGPQPFTRGCFLIWLLGW